MSRPSGRPSRPGSENLSQQLQVLYLYDRPSEPVFVPKGDKKVAYDVPNSYLPDKFRPVADELGTRFGDEDTIRYPINEITIPDISLPLRLGRRENFSLFIPYHRRLASRLIDVFMGMRNYEDFLSASVFCRDRINPYMYIYCLSVAILHRPDTRHLQIPSLAEVFPDKYMDSAVFAEAREESNVLTEGTRNPLEIPRDYTATDLDPEHKVAYFREDVGINLHHWHWHLVYPFDAARNIVNKDRRGELFYYMHQQIMGRYNFERMCNNLQRTVRFINWREPIPEGYFPKLDSLVASRIWPPRPSGLSLRDINREADQIQFDIQDLERWRDRIFEAIHRGFVLNEQGDRVNLTEDRGIDVLGNIVESSILSVNRNLYGDVHNLGHVAIALSHDPDHRHLETFGVMGDPATAMRDPIFYRWHAFIDDLFREFKNTLPRYTTQQLNFPGIRVLSVEIQTPNMAKNLLTTFWQQNDIDLSRGLDFTPRGSVFARLTQLQHSPFSYRIQVENNNSNQLQGTVRIFMAPKVDERGQPFLFRDQKNLMIELDKFTVTLRNNPRVTTIQRGSDQSSVTIPFERTFRDLESRPTDASQEERFNYCGCGWPQHMLIPKGTEGGFDCELFVMISNWEDDKVQQASQSGGCSDAASYCGVRDSLFPDKRSMGFPFDRMPRDGVDTLSQFLTPNMKVQDVTIRFTDRVEPPRMGGNTVPNQ